jgi:hypothetical protein
MSDVIICKTGVLINYLSVKFLFYEKAKYCFNAEKNTNRKNSCGMPVVINVLDRTFTEKQTLWSCLSQNQRLITLN